MRKYGVKHVVVLGCSFLGEVISSSVAVDVCLRDHAFKYGLVSLRLLRGPVQMAMDPLRNELIASASFTYDFDLVP